MIYLKWAWILFQVLFVLWIVSFLIRPFVSYEKQQLLQDVDEFIVQQLISIPTLVSKLWQFTGTTLYYLGNFAALIVLLLGILSLCSSIFLHIQEIEFSLESILNFARLLAEEKTTLPSAASVVAATVAIGHMWKLNLDKRQYDEKCKKERREEYEARRQKEHERRMSQSGLV